VNDDGPGTEPTGTEPATTADAESRRRPRRVALFVAAALGSVAVALAIAVASGADLSPVETEATPARVSASPEPATTEPPAAAAPIETPIPADGKLAPETAAVTVGSLLVALAAHAEDPSASTDSLSSLATGAILDEVAADTEELKANGWSRTGTAKVGSVRVIATDAATTPATATIEACIDSSDVRLLDLAGDVIGDPLASPRSLNIYSLEHDGAVWRVTSRTFPDDAAC
jgi:hypothetical protein